MTTTEVIKLIFEGILVIGGLGGFVSIFMFRKQDGRIKEAEAAAQEATAQTSIVGNYETLLDRYEKSLKDSDDRLETSNKFHTDRYNFIQKQLDVNSRKVQELVNNEKKLKPWVCYVDKCELRKSKQS